MKVGRKNKTQAAKAQYMLFVLWKGEPNNGYEHRFIYI